MRHYFLRRPGGHWACPLQGLDALGRFRAIASGRARNELDADPSVQMNQASGALQGRIATGSGTSVKKILLVVLPT